MKYTKKPFIKIKDTFGDGHHLMAKEDFINWMESVLKNGNMFQIDEYSIIERKQLSDDKLAKLRDNMVNKNLVKYDLDKLEYVIDMDILFENLFDEDQEELNMMVEKVLRKQKYKDFKDSISEMSFSYEVVVFLS